ncbi:hypothetical protein, partial [Mesorhizobium sp. M4B.F.Ca.ET.169.01.1.1]|uniref:hypothetical protein n=1 Tax=Mesorhizobium sp. M4B.F.Ca.ET.169.01.1.1 TaxID=2563949 RepID=UPI001AEDAAD5
KKYTQSARRSREFEYLYNQWKLNVFCMHAQTSVSPVPVRASFLSRAKTRNNAPNQASRAA